MKITITGAKGQLGKELETKLKKTNETSLVDVDNYDITNKKEIFAFLNKIRPEIIIHGAAYTDVDGCEKNPTIANAVNFEGTKNLVDYSKENKTLFLYVSTDFVFDGSKDTAYTEEDPTNPLSTYGRTKLAGEGVVQNNLKKYFITRTAWLYGQGNNFVRKIIELANKNKDLKVVDDQYGSPTYAKDLADAISKLILTQDYGIYHVVNSGGCSRYEFATEIVTLGKLDSRILPISSSEFKATATRPTNSILNISKLISKGIYMRNWKEALNEYIHTFFIN